MSAIAIARNGNVAEVRGAETVSPQLSLVPVTRKGDADAAAIHLTPRQLEVLALLCEGLPNKLICRRLNISAGTVKAHLSSILRELGVASRLQAVVVARRRGIVADFETSEHDANSEGAGHNGARETSFAIQRRPTLN